MAEARFVERFISFNDAVVAIAITLLVLPLVDAASKIGGQPIGRFLDHNYFRLVAFALSFVVIGKFWWEEHKSLNRLIGYDMLLVWSSFVWEDPSVNSGL